MTQTRAQRAAQAAASNPTTPQVQQQQQTPAPTPAQQQQTPAGSSTRNERQQQQQQTPAGSSTHHQQQQQQTPLGSSAQHQQQQQQRPTGQTFTLRDPNEDHTTINLQRLGGRHEWKTAKIPAGQMNFSSEVLENEQRRPDMSRWHQLHVENQRDSAQTAHNAWSNFSGGHKWFRIPDTLECDRTFARCAEEAYYLEAMDEFITLAAANNWNVQFNPRRIPIIAVRDQLLGRWWHAPGVTNDLIQAMRFAETNRLFVPHDSYDTELATANVQYLATIYPAAPHWWNLFYFPGAIPCPMPPSLFYYHMRMMNAAAQEEIEFWDTILQYEVASLFAAQWWHEAARGHRGWIIPEETIRWLEVRLEDIPIERQTGGRHITFPIIAQRMRDAANANRDLRNRLEGSGHTYVDDHFVPTHHENGYVDVNGVCGRTLRRNKRGRLILVDSGHQQRPRFNRLRRNYEDHQYNRRRERENEWDEYRPRQRSRNAHHPEGPPNPQHERYPPPPPRGAQPPPRRAPPPQPHVRPHGYASQSSIYPAQFSHNDRIDLILDLQNRAAAVRTNSVLRSDVNDLRNHLASAMREFQRGQTQRQQQGQQSGRSNARQEEPQQRRRTPFGTGRIRKAESNQRRIERLRREMAAANPRYAYFNAAIEWALQENAAEDQFLWNEQYCRSQQPYHRRYDGGGGSGPAGLV